MHKRMRVLTLTPFYPSASDDAWGCFVAEPLDALKKFEVESYVIAVEPFYRARSTLNGRPAQWVRYAAIPGGLGLASSGMFLYRRLLTIVDGLHSSRPFDLIHAHAALPCGRAASLLSRTLRVPFVITIHGLDVVFTRQVRGYPGQWCKNAARRVYSSARQVICISQRVANEVNTHVNDIKATVIHNGVDEQRFCPAKDGREDAIILSVGELIPSKGYEVLLQAFAAVHQEYPNASYEIIGDGPQRSVLTRLAERLNIASEVRFLGRKSRQEVASAIQRCTIFALPSEYEGLGCVYLEAMSTGKPAIGCRGQGIEDIIQHGHNGWLINPGNLEDMICALSTLLNDAELRTRLGTAARKTIMGGFTLKHQASRLAQVYRECMA